MIAQVGGVTINPSTYAFPIGTTIVTWIVTDGSGLTASCPQNVTVTDDENPTITCPTDISQNDDPESDDALVTVPDAIINDNCAVTLLTWSMTGATVATSLATGINQIGAYIFNTGVTFVTYIVKDAAGNQATCTFTVTITDNIDPTITCPSNISKNDDAGVCNALVVVPNVVIADNYELESLTWTMTGATVASSPAIGINQVGTFTFNTGLTLVTYTVKDPAGNEATCNFTVTITDNIAPAISCPANIIHTADAGPCSYSVAVGLPVTSDNCGVLSVLGTRSDALLLTDPYPVGLTTIHWVVTDIHSNSSSCDQSITITDDELPVAICKNININLDLLTGLKTIAAADINNGSSDNCGIASITASKTNFDCTDIGANNVILTVTDVHGNISTCNSVVTVDYAVVPSPIVNPASDIICDGVTTNLLLTNNIPATSWTWTISAPPEITGGSDDLTGTKTSIQQTLINTGVIAYKVVYTIIPKIYNSCDLNPISAEIWIEPRPRISVATDPVICYDGDAIFNISTVNLTVSPGGEWKYDVSAIYPAGVTGDWSAGLTNQTAASLTDNLTNNNNTVQTVIYTFTPHISPGDGGQECLSGVQIIRTVKIDPQPKIAVTTDPVLCYDGDAVFNISTVNTAVSAGGQWRYDVSVSYPAGVNGDWLAGLTNQTAASLTDNLTNTTDLVQTVTYTFTPHIRPGDGGPECSNGIPIILSVQIDPQPKVIVTTDPVLCYDGDAVFNISTPNTAVSTGGQWRYDVEITYPADVTGTFGGPGATITLLNQTSLGLTALTDDLTNNGDIVGIVTYKFTPHIQPGDLGAECGGGVVIIKTVEIDPQPKVIVTTDPVLCYDGDALFNISTPNTAVSTGGQWRYDVSVSYPAGVNGDWLAGLTNQTAASLTDNLTNTTDLVQTVTYTFTPHIRPGDGGPECANGIPIIITVQIDPQPKIAVTTDPVLCYDGDAVFNITTPNTAVSTGGQWRYDVSVSYPAGVNGDWLAGLTNQTAATLTDNLTNTTDLVQTVTYTFTPHIRPGDGGPECANGLPIILTVQIDPQPKITVTTDPVLCYDGDAVFNISTPNTAVSTGGQWRYDLEITYPADVNGTYGTAGSVVTINNLTITGIASITDDLTNVGDVVRTVTYKFTPHILPGDGGSECQNGVVIIKTVEIDPQPKIAVTTDPVLCYDGDAVFNISTVNTAVSTGGQWRYDVSVSYPAGVNGDWLAGLTNQTAASLTDNLTNTTDLVQTVTYTFTPHIRPGDGGPECSNGIPIILSVQIDPQPKVIVTTDPVLCYDGDAVFNISTPNTAVSTGGQWRYDVEITYPADVTGTFGGPGATITLLNQTSLGLTALTDDLTNNGDIVGIVTYKFTPHIQPGDLGAECGGGVVIIKTVEIDPQPKVIVTTDPVLCYDGDALFNISTPNTAVSTGGQWRYDVSVSYPAGVNGDWLAGLTNQTAASLTDNLTNTTDLVQTVTYTFTPHIRPGDGGPECANGIPIIITVQIDPQPKIAVTTDPVLCYDGDAVFNITTPNTAVSTGGQWRYDVSVSYPAGVNGDWLAGLTNQTAATLTDNLTNTTDLVQTVTYTFTPHIRPGDGGPECANGLPIILTVQIDPQPKITVTTDPVLCYDGDAVFNISTPNTAVSTGGQWRYDLEITYPADVNGTYGTAGSVVTINNLTITGIASITDDLTNVGDVVRTVTYKFTPHILPGDGGSECQNGVVIIKTVEIDPQPKIDVTTDPVLCYDGDAVFNISTVNTAVSTGGQWRYDVSVSYPAGVNGDWLAGLTNQTAATLTDNLTNTTDLVQTVTYTFTPHIRPGDGGPECANGLPIILTVQIDPQPKITVTTDPVLCYDGDAVFDITSPNTAVSTGGQWRYDIEITYPADVTGTYGGPGATVTLTNKTATGVSALTDDLTNAGNIVRTVTYKFTPHIQPGDLGTECGNGVVIIKTVEIDPQPKIAVTTDPVLCYDGDAVFNISTVNTAVSTGGQWRYDVSVSYPAGVNGDWLAGLTNQTAATLTDNLNNTTDLVQTVTYTFTPHIRPGDGGPECANGIPIIITVQIDPQPKIAVTTDPVLCYDGDAVFNITTPNTAVSTGGQWRYDVSVSYPAGVNGDWLAGLTNQTAATLTDNLTNTTDLVQTVTYTFTPHIRPGDGGPECANGIQIIIPVQIDPQPKISVTTDPVLCYDGDAVFNISTPNTAVSTGGQWRYDLEITYPADVNGTYGTAGSVVTINNLTITGLTAITDDLTNIGDVVRTVTYKFTPHILPGDGGSECQNGVVIIKTVEIDPQPKIAVTTDPVLCYDGDAVFNISTPNTAVSTGGQWRYDVSVSYPAGVNGDWLAGLTNQTAASLTDNLTNTTDLVQTVTYTFTPHIRPGDGGPECANGLPIILTVQIDPQPKITVTTDPVLCYDGDAVFNISTPNTAVSTGGQWRYDVEITYPADVTGTFGGPGATITLLNQTSLGLTALTDDLTNNGDIVGIVTYKFTPHIQPGDLGAECGGGVVIIKTVEIDPQPKIAVTTDPVLCYDGDAVFNISTVNTAVSTGGQWRYDVSVSYPAGVNGDWLAGLTNQTAASLTDNLTNTTDLVQTVTYTFTPHIRPGDGGPECSNGIPIILSVQIDPQPKVIVTTDPVLCYDGDAVFNISTVNTAVSTGGQWRYDIEITYPADVTGTYGGPGTTVTLTNQTATGVSALLDDLTNAGDIVRTVTYKFTPHILPGDGGSECQNGVVIIKTVEIDPQPKIDVTTDPVLCYDGDAVFNISTVNTAVSTGGQWRYDVSVSYPAGVNGDWLAGLTNQTAASLTDNLTNTTDLVQTVTYTFTPHIRPGDGGPECANGIPITLTIQIDPQPKLAVATDPVLCYDGDAVFNISTPNTAVSTGGQWRYDIEITYPADVTGTYGGPGTTVPLTNQTATGVSALLDDLTNAGDIVRTVTYKFTPHIQPGDLGAECGNGIVITKTVQIDPQPKIAVTTDPVLCYDGDAVFNISTVNTAVSTGGQWRYDLEITYPADVNGTYGTAGSVVTINNLTITGLASITDDLTNIGDVVRTVTYKFTPHILPGDGGSECQNGVVIIKTVEIDPQPKDRCYHRSCSLL